MSTFREIQKEFAKQQVQPILYSYNVLKVATKDFHPSNKLGEGGFGAVYKGILLDGTHVAVKLLNKSHQQVSEFLNEIVLMTGVRHKNLVKVKGCSLQGTQRLIVFEFVENKNLAEALWERPIKNVLLLDWTMRFNICVGIAHGLIYLHEYLQPRIIHRDIKASNILLDKDLNPKIADFGLARLFPEDISHLSTAHIAGTMGYLSPEYATLGKLTEKVDVFSYGVLLLEIVSGRKNIDLSLETNKIYLLEWAHSLHEQDKLFDLIDQQLNNNILDDEARRVIDVALLCVQTSASRRPLMSHVLAMLLNGVDMEDVSKKTNSIHEMEISSLLGFHHVIHWLLPRGDQSSGAQGGVNCGGFRKFSVCLGLMQRTSTIMNSTSTKCSSNNCCDELNICTKVAQSVGHLIEELQSKVTNSCHFLRSCRDGKWLCRCKQHDLFAANTYQFFVKFPSLRESNCAVSVCACAENALKALYTGWGILSTMGGMLDPCLPGWEGVICVDLVQFVEPEFAKQQVQPILYSYNVLKLATKDFHPSNKLGEGGFGAVYKGILLDGTHVAVKLLTKSHQQVNDFLNEIVLMTGVRHKNLVKVKGCSLQGTQRLIVFEFVENKNLAEALWDRPIKNVLLLDWTMRFNICVGIAHGLIYLHEYLQPRIIHRDIKAPNILLDKDLNPKIADFGLARLFPEDISHLSTAHIAGTMGYLSPEYATLGKLTEKVDVFSYGVLLLEIVSGRKNIDLSLETNKIYLLEWACSLHEQDRLMDLIDQRLNNNVSNDEAQRVINVALLCVQTSATRRPSMSHVLAMLLNEVDVEVVSKKANRIHEMDVSHLFQSNSSLSPSGLI
ncbi:unnamed protein product [Sphagnum troendelagicum]